MTRQYANRLREDQQELTRARILEAVRDELEEHLPDELSFAAVAARAKISERTVYRHFETKEALFDAFWTAWIAGPFGVPTDDAMDVDALPRYAHDLYSAFQRHEGISRALVSSRVGREVRQRSRGGRRKAVETSLAPIIKKLGPDGRKRVVGVFQMLHSIATWHTLRERTLSGTDAAAAVDWISRVLIAELRANPSSVEATR